MSSHVDKVTVTVTGFYKDLAVQSFELVVAVNAIPHIILNVLPIEKPKKGTGQYVTASAPKIQDITELYSSLLSDAIMLNQTATIKINHTTPYDSEDLLEEEKYQFVELKNWIMSDVGLSTITSTSAPVLSVTFSHPAVKLDRSGTIYENVENPLELVDIYKNAGGDEIISYMDSIYETYASEDDIEFTDIASVGDGGPDDEYKQKVEQFRTSGLTKNLPGKYIEGKTEGFFLEVVEPSLRDDMIAFTGPIVAPQAFCRTTWNRLVTEICPQFLTTIIPTYDKEKLKHEPLSPWQECSYEIDTKIVSSLDVVSIDPSPLIGTAVIKDVLVDDAVIDWNSRGYNCLKYDKTYAFYFPELVRSEDIPGEVLNLGEPAILANIGASDEAANSVDGFNGPYGENLEDAGNHLEEETREKLNEAYAEAMFQINYRKNCKATVITTPLFKINYSTTIYPGRVMTVRDPSTDSRLFYGYITRILTKGSAEGGCMTVFELAYARPAYGNATVTKILIKEGEENPCYPKISRSDSE